MAFPSDMKQQRSVAGPGADLLHLSADGGARGIAIRYQNPWAGHLLLTKGIAGIKGFLEAPGVEGIAPMTRWDPADSTLSYRAEGLAVAELMKVLDGVADRERCGLELLAQVATILDDALEAAEAHGVYSHGGLTPWRIIVDSAGETMILGFGIPQVEVVAYLDEETDEAPIDVFRFCVPERLEDKDEDVRSDLCSLGLVVAELITGLPVLSGSADQIIDKIFAGAAPDAVEHTGRVLSDSALDLLCSMVEAKPADRPRTGKEAAKTALLIAKAAAGPSLTEVMSGLLGGDDEETDPQPVAAPEPEPVAERAVEPVVEPVVAPPPEPVAEVRPAPAPEPSPSTAASTESITLAAPIPPLGEAPSLGDVKAHANAIVDRTEKLADQADALLATAEELASQASADLSMELRGLAADAAKARKAFRSARGSANLLELDEDAAGALITLDMVTGAETQGYNAAAAVASGIATFERRIAAERLEGELTQQAITKARNHANEALEAATEADELATALEAGTQGDLPELSAAHDDAFQASEHAHRAATRASDALDLAKEAGSAAEAQAHAEEAGSAAEEAMAAVSRARTARADAERAAAAAATSAIEEADGLAARADDAAESAEQAVERAAQAMKIASTAESSTHRRTAESKAKSARKAALLAASEAERVRTATDRAVALDGLGAIRDALETAEQEAEEARAASDSVVQIAGAAAQRAADLSKAQSDAEAMGEQATRAVQRAEADIERLLEEIASLTGHRVHSRRDDAVAALTEARALAKEIHSQAQAAQRIASLDEAVALVAELATRVQATEQHVETCISCAARARELGEDELAEIREREANAKEIRAAQTAAQEHADQCKKLVDAAQAEIRGMSEALRDTDIERAIELRDQALEIVDIAAFQAGEAASSAEYAAAEEDPAEARAHAETARSFVERIATDLPEAHSAFEEAEELANREIRQFAQARTATSAALAAVEEGGKTLQRLIDEAGTRAGQWIDSDGVIGAIANLRAVLGTLGDERTEAQYAADRVEQVRSGEGALEMVPVATDVAKRMAGKLNIAQTLVEGVDRAIAAAEAEANALTDTQAEAREAEEGTANVLQAIDEAAGRLEAAVSERRATSDEVAAERTRMTRALTVAKAALNACRGAREAAEASTTAEEAKAQVAIARTALQKAEAQQEVAAEAEAAGVAAAEREERERRETLALQISNAREAANENALRARQIADKLSAAIAAAKDEFSPRAHDALLLRADAEKSAKTLANLAAKAEAAAKIAADGDEVDDIVDKAAATRKIADLAEERAEAGHKTLLDAIDLARNAQAEAEALVKVRAEVKATIEAVNDAVNRAKKEAKLILRATRDKARVRELVERAASHIATAKKAAKKVEATAPLIDDAEHLATATSILKTCRATVQRAESEAEAVRELHQIAMDEQRQADEQSAQDLAEARSRAVEPAQEAIAAARKAEGWLETGRREAEGFDEPAVAAAVDALQAQVEKVQAIASEAQDATAPAATAESVEAAAEVEAEVRGIVERARALADDTTAALAEVRAATEFVRQTRRAIQFLEQEGAELAETIGHAATQASAVADELAGLVGASEQTSARALKALSAVMAGAKAANDALARANAPSEASTMEEWEEHVDGLQDLLSSAIEGLEAVVENDASCREAIQRMEKEAAEARAAAEQEAKEAAEAAHQAESEQKLNEAEDEDAKRRERLEERRSRFQRRRKEGVSSQAPSSAPLLESGAFNKPADDLSDGTPRKRSERPRRTGRRIPKDTTKETPEETPKDTPKSEERKVRSWKPGERGATKASATSARPRRARPRADKPPEPSSPSTGSGADRLLERLRRRKLEEGE